ncbi:exoribonuclease 2 [Desarmillaria tabescens]|uniref:5'-3' exoribonuclease 2 n=1 Tax=Armillaria tabescens TaxID=1929756 RepID=A0AA39NAB5_ARMTA|nr:exoribonuclease 2 [Desarmillaria tabescens]KAK0461903.1 exoribonuclease 2 [Desarmillaria tabescens]
MRSESDFLYTKIVADQSESLHSDDDHRSLANHAFVHSGDINLTIIFISTSASLSKLEQWVSLLCSVGSAKSTLKSSMRSPKTNVTIRTGDPGDPEAESIDIPVNMADPNPNGTEFDNLYLDMNGIVHPCTHPEGKPAPETEEDMMMEVFKYTERVVNMIRPRKLLFMAIDGVAPRAKMNQQRSRRFRAAQEAKDKEEARKESVALWESMGKEISADEKNKKAWDSNAITPGTPFMALLASSLRYWVVQKMNSDCRLEELIISDASVPGEGEHKIMDFIRRQRVNPGHDPNTRHVIYGLDADLIMLALATHEPHFRVLREDVFSDANSTSCRKCGQEGHYAAQCTVSEDEIQRKASAVVQKPKPFIFLDVAVLREYLEVELDTPQATFPFDLERAIDDWVLLIFFVGNDFLPHLPSLEIREGAIDTLLRIWKQELPRMGGYLANHGQLELSRVQIILEGLARREDEIFKRRREAEDRQDANAKRRKLEAQNGKTVTVGSSSSASQTGGPTTPSSNSSSYPAHPSLPQRPDFAANADSIGLGGPRTTQSQLNMSAATQALAGSNRDVVANIRAIRMANMSAAEMLKAELSGKPDLSLPAKPPATADVPSATLDASRMRSPSSRPTATVMQADSSLSQDISMESITDVPQIDDDSVVAGTKRKVEEGPEADDDTLPDEEEEDTAIGITSSLSLKVNADGTVEQEDTVKLWEPGYKERYYRQKFGVELSDVEFRKALVKHYVEGMAWILRYYYQGAPSWQWYYPHHFAPFASDFVDIEALDITFDLGEPFKPFEQLMGVFPAASRMHIPAVFHSLMLDEDSPIIDYYPESFQIDMNGKRMAWQGVALLPFIDEKRLLAAMALHYDGLSEEEVRRNSWGNSIIFASDEHPIYPFYEQLYGKRKSNKAVTIDTALSKGISGSALPNPDCIPGSTYFNPLTNQDLPDIRNDRSLSVIYFFPKQITPHRSVMLPGVKKGPRVLQAQDLETTRSGGRGRGRGSWDRGGGRGGGGRSNGNDRPRGGDPFHSRPSSYGPPSRGNDRGYEGRGGGGNSYHPSPYQSRPPPPPQQQYGGGGYGGYGGDAGAGAYGGYGGGAYGGGRSAYGDSGPPRGGPPPNSYGGYGGYGSGGGAYGGGGSGGPYGGYGQGGGYGGGGYGSSSGSYGQSTNGYGGYNSGGRGGSGYSSRGRGRAW